jgi:hypothetical protein
MLPLTAPPSPKTDRRSAMEAHERKTYLFVFLFFVIYTLAVTRRLPGFDGGDNLREKFHRRGGDRSDPSYPQRLSYTQDPRGGGFVSSSYSSREDDSFLRDTYQRSGNGYSNYGDNGGRGDGGRRRAREELDPHGGLDTEDPSAGATGAASSSFAITGPHSGFLSTLFGGSGDKDDKNAGGRDGTTGATSTAPHGGVPGWLGSDPSTLISPPPSPYRSSSMYGAPPPPPPPAELPSVMTRHWRTGERAFLKEAESFLPTTDKVTTHRYEHLYGTRGHRFMMYMMKGGMARIRNFFTKSIQYILHIL